MQFKSHLLAQASGSVAGVTYTRSAASQVIRSRTMPSGTGTAAAAIARSTLAYLANRWSNDLTADQRTAWSNYARAVPSTNRLGDTVNPTGKGAYIRNWSARLQWDATESILDDPPNILHRPDLVITRVFWDTGRAYMDWDRFYEWSSHPSSFIIFYASKMQSAAKVFYNRQFTAFAILRGDDPRPFPPYDITPPWATVTTNALFFRFVATTLRSGMNSTPIMPLPGTP